MAFAARRDDDGTWRLCLRKGKTFRTATLYHEQVPLAFPSQAKAKACADILNERYWKQYEKHEKKQTWPPFAYEMVEVIKEYMK
jgi:hypothetical protein